MNALPTIMPIIPKKAKAAFDDPDWLFDLKYDGFRGVLYFDGKSCRLVSKAGKRLPFKALEAQLAKCLEVKNAVLDGEVVSLDPSRRSIFRDLLRREGRIAYVAFDAMYVNGRDLRDRTLLVRKAILSEVAEVHSKTCIMSALWKRESGRAYFDLAIEHDLEGIIAKRIASAYTRRTEWLKILNPAYSQRKDRGMIRR